MRLPAPVHAVNEGLAFLLELVAFGCLAWWGFTVNFALGLALPILAIVLWGLFAAPRARFRLPVAGVLAVKALVFGSAAAALYGVDQATLGLVFA
ncbi:DUF2568 domain-containing protein, partial [Amycolatopsis rhizosphaerae]